MIGQHRTQISLEPQQHQALVEIAQQEQRSISDIVRQIISQYLERREVNTQKKRALEALERLTCLREKIEKRAGLYQGDLLAEARAERDAQTARIWGGQYKDRT